MSKPPPRPPGGMSNDEMTREIYVRIVGDGTDANPGLDKRTDRLEGRMKLLFGALAIMGSAFLTYGVDWFLGIFHGKKP